MRILNRVSYPQFENIIQLVVAIHRISPKLVDTMDERNILICVVYEYLKRWKKLFYNNNDDDKDDRVNEVDDGDSD